MKMNEPVGDALYGPLFLRVTLGAYFVMAGLRKLDRLETFIQGVRGFKILPDHVATLYGIIIPYLEVGAGALLLLGIWTTLGALMTSFLLATYLFAVGIFPDAATGLFNKDLILLGASICLLFTGSGALSIDRFRKTG